MEDGERGLLSGTFPWLAHLKTGVAATATCVGRSKPSCGDVRAECVTRWMDGEMGLGGSGGRVDCSPRLARPRSTLDFDLSSTFVALALPRGAADESDETSPAISP